MAAIPPSPLAVRQLVQFLRRSQHLAILTGAGISTESGIPDYRGPGGVYTRNTAHKPVTYQQFVRSEAARKRYWARGLVGFARFSAASPNAAHLALARLAHRSSGLITQNVDRLHIKAGSHGTIQLHGDASVVKCLSCGAKQARAAVHDHILAANPLWQRRLASLTRWSVDTPDGDADLATDTDYSTLEVPACGECGGLLKPDVVFFGENVPKEIADAAAGTVASSDALLVVGTTATTQSALRLVEGAAGRPVCILNLGPTRADGLATLRLAEPCGALITEAVEHVLGPAPVPAS